MTQRYTARHKISEGGYGLIRAGRDQELARDVVIKELKPGRTSSVERARLVREAHVQARLQHPCMVPVYGIGEWQDGSPYYVMQQLSGLTLYDAVTALHDSDTMKVSFSGGHSGESSSIHLSFRDLIARFKELCLAVEFAHQKGVVHRDITPRNLMLGFFGENHIIDWGTAKVAPTECTGELDLRRSSDGLDSLNALLGRQGRHLETRTGAVFGTPGFMSPEHLKSAKSVDHLADVYGLGATLYFILTGQSPKEPPHGQYPNALISGQTQPRSPAIPSKLNRRVDSQLEAICLRAMQPERERRYQSCRELANDLSRWLDARPVRARAERLGERLRRWIRQHSVSALVSVILLAAGVFTVQYAYHSRGLQTEIGNHAQTIVSLGDRTLRDYILSPSKENSMLLANARNEMLGFVLRRRLRLRSLPASTRDALGNAAFLIARIEDQIGEEDQQATKLLAKEILEELQACYPSQRTLEMLCEVSQVVAKSMADEGKMPEAIQTIESTQRLREQLRGGTNRVDYLAEYARGCSFQGKYYLANNQPAEAVDALLRAMEIRKEIDSRLIDDSVAQLDFARANMDLAQLFREAGEYERALSLYHNSLHWVGASQQGRRAAETGRLLRSNLIAGDFKYLQASIRQEIGKILLLEGERILARESFASAMQDYYDLLSDYPAVLRYRVGKCQLMTWIALSYERLDGAAQQELLREANQVHLALKDLPTQSLEEPEVKADFRCLRMLVAFVDTAESRREDWEGLVELAAANRADSTRIRESRISNLRERLCLALIAKQTSTLASDVGSSRLEKFQIELKKRIATAEDASQRIGRRLDTVMQARAEELGRAELRHLVRSPKM